GVGRPEVLVGARCGVCRGGFECFEVGVAEPEPIEAEQGAVGSGEAVAGLAFENLAEQDIAGIRVVEVGAGLEERLSVRHRKPYLLGARPTVVRLADDERLEGGIVGVVIEAACVPEQVSDANAIDVVAAVPKQRDRRRAQMLCDRVVERELAVLGKAEDRGGGERLGDAGEAKGGSGAERLSGGSVGEAGCARPGHRWCRYRERDAGKAWVCACEPVQQLVEPRRQRRRGRGGRRGRSLCRDRRREQERSQGQRGGAASANGVTRVRLHGVFSCRQRSVAGRECQRVNEKVTLPAWLGPSTIIASLRARR